MPMIAEKDQQTIREWFKRLQNPVRLVVFTQEVECEYCRQARQMCTEIAALSDLVSVEVYDLVRDQKVAQTYGIDKIPAVAIIGEQDYGVRYYGLAAGYEFTALVEDMIDVSTGEHGLSENTLSELARLDRPVHLQVFVTPTCPYCPRAVRLAHKLAIASDQVRADSIEAVEFPHLANRYQVFGVPLTVVNDRLRIEGAMPEARFVHEMMRILEEREAAWHG